MEYEVFVRGSMTRKRIPTTHEKWVSTSWTSELSSLAVHRCGSAATANANLSNSSTRCNTNADAGVRVENGSAAYTKNHF